MSNIRHIPVHLKLREAFTTARGKIGIRRGFLLDLEHENQKYVSEISLMPEFGTEYFEHAERILNGETLMLPSAPATLFGLDCLRYVLEKQTENPVSVPIALLLPNGERSEIVDAALRVKDLGFTSLKIKVGFREVSEDVLLVNELTNKVPGVKFRVDANLSWTMEQVDTFLQRIETSAIEWVEDPFRGTLEDWSLLQANSQVSFASDEAFAPSEIMSRKNWNGFEIFIVKPGRLGTIADIKKYCERAKLERKKIVFSSMFESSVGMSYLACLAEELGSVGVAHGLGTLHYLESDTLKTPLKISEGWLTAPPLKNLYDLLKPEYASKLK